jgi:hypothetical protein
VDERGVVGSLGKRGWQAVEYTSGEHAWGEVLYPTGVSRSVHLLLAMLRLLLRNDVPSVALTLLVKFQSTNQQPTNPILAYPFLMHSSPSSDTQTLNQCIQPRLRTMPTPPPCQISQQRFCPVRGDPGEGGLERVMWLLDDAGMGQLLIRCDEAMNTHPIHEYLLLAPLISYPQPLPRIYYLADSQKGHVKAMET